jgi:hypothetical protein
LLVTMRAVYQTEWPLSNSIASPKNGVHSEKSDTGLRGRMKSAVTPAALSSAECR